MMKVILTLKMSKRFKICLSILRRIMLQKDIMLSIYENFSWKLIQFRMHTYQRVVQHGAVRRDKSGAGDFEPLGGVAHLTVHANLVMSLKDA